MDDTHDEAELLDERTGSNHKAEFIVKQEVSVIPDLTDDEIMEILNYAMRINK